MLSRNTGSKENSNTERAIKAKITKPVAIALLFIGIFLLNAGLMLAQQAQTTEGKADINLKSAARINPSTFAMEFSLPLGSYPGRGGNSIPISLSYSSKLWDTKMFNFRQQQSSTSTPNHYEVLMSTDIAARFARQSISGWTSSLQPPAIKNGFPIYNQSGEFFTIYNGVPLSTGDNRNTNHVVGEFQASSSCQSGMAYVFSYDEYCDNDGNCSITHVDQVCVDPPVTPTMPGTLPSPVPQVRNVVPRMEIRMPDGSLKEFRKEDKIYSCQGLSLECGQAQNYGTYLSVDGSAMRLAMGEVQPGTINETRDVLYMPDGSRYIFPPASSNTQPYRPAEKYIDRNGNFSTYDAMNQEWTDTLERQIADPLPNPLTGEKPGVEIQEVKLKGIDNQIVTYKIDWKTLDDTLENTNTQLKYIGKDTCEDIQLHPVAGASLFANYQELENQLTQNSSIFYTKNKRICSGRGETPEIFNPVVMAEIVLPDNQKYKFKYNEYGEITRIDYPTGGYERFEYQEIKPLGVTAEPVYTQTNRGVHKRHVSFDGLTETTTTYEQFNEGVGANYAYGVRTIAPDGSKSERILYHSEGSGWGFEDPRNGMVKEERARDINGQLRSWTLTDWKVKTPTPGPGIYNNALRDARPFRTVSVMIENGKALATLSTVEYDEYGSTDPQYFSHLNAKKSKSYHYKALLTNPDTGPTTAPEGDIDAIAGMFAETDLAAVSTTAYSYDSGYKARGIIGLPTLTTVLNPANPDPSAPNGILAKSQILYDEQNQYYSPGPDNTTTVGYAAPTGTYANLRGNATTTKTWVKETDTWLESHAQYDTFGNLRKAWDARNNPNVFAETQYSSDYYYAYPTKVITPAPDLYNADFGTTATSQAETTYDLTTGLPLSVKNDAGQITKTEYDAFMRPWRVYAFNYTAPETQTIYGTPELNGQLPESQRFVKVRKQLDGANWDEATTWFDGLGRTIRTQTKDSQEGDVVARTEYDEMGRVKRTTNPYRVDATGNAAETVFWSKPRYDAAGRAVESFAPAPDGQTGASLGITSFDISTVQGYVGTVVVSTDASLRKSRSITNALGQLLRVDEPTGVGGTEVADLGDINTPIQPTYYKYDAYGKMVRVQQGKTGETIQNRYFLYDSLGRLIRVRQPEQEVNSALATTQAIDGNSQWTAGFAYDVLGNIKRATDASGVNVVSEYDNLNRVKLRCYTKANVSTTATACSQISSADFDPGTPSVYFTYDGRYYSPTGAPLTATGNAKGSLTQVRNGISTSQTTKYDAFGRATEYEQLTDGQTYNSKYTYNFAGALETETYPNGRVVKNEFDSDGDLLRISGKANANANEKTYANSFAYTADGRIAKLKLGNGLWEAAKFNSRLQITELGLGVGTDNQNLWKINYDYGEIESNGTLNAAKNTGNIARQTISFQGLTNPFVQTYKYDSLNRLKEAAETSGTTTNWTQTFGYDRFGNRTSFSQQGGAVPIAQPTIDQNTNRFNINQGYAYDKNGNVTTDAASGAARTFTFNGDNKQTEVKDANGTLIGKYFYDGDGKRVKKQTYDENGNVKEVTVFVYSGGKLIAEYSTAAPPTNPTTNFVATDILESVRAITNALGEVTSRRDFMPFGEELISDANYRMATQKYSSSEDKVRQKFTGYQKDAETSLDFAEARMYENRQGRFTAIDPLLASGKSANPQTFNRYAYVMSNPLKFTDPTGLQVAATDDEVIQGPTAWTLAKARLSELGAALYNKINELIDQGHSPEESFRIARFGVMNTAQDAPLKSVKVFNESMVKLDENVFQKEPSGLYKFGSNFIGYNIGERSGTDLAISGSEFGLNIVTLPLGGGTTRKTLQEGVEISGTKFFHGTTREVALSFLDGEGLNATKAAASKIDGPSGFFLAENYDDAVFFAIRREQPVVLEFNFSDNAMRQLSGCGIICQPIPAGNSARFLGNELIFPTNSFSTFNRLRRAGEITISPALP